MALAITDSRTENVAVIRKARATRRTLIATLSAYECCDTMELWQTLTGDDVIAVCPDCGHERTLYA